MTDLKFSNNSSSGGGEHLDAPIDWRGYLHSIRERLWLVLLLMALGAGCAYYVVLKSVPVYASRCTVSVERQDHVLTKIESVKSDVSDNSWVSTISEMMKSATLRSRLILRLKSTADPAFQPPSFTITNRAGSTFIDVVAEHTDPQVAQEWANGLVEEYQKFRMESVSAATATANKFLLDEAKRLRDNLTASELALQEYREQKNAVSLEKDQDVVISRFRELSDQYNAAKDRRARIESDMTNAKEIGGNPAELAKLSSVTSQPAVVAAQTALNNVENRMAVLKLRYLPKHPKYKELQTELGIYKERFTATLITAGNSLNTAYAEAADQEKRLQDEMQSQEKKGYELGKLGVSYDKLKREIEADQAIYNQVLTRLKETDLTKGLEEIYNVPLRVVEPATASAVPVRPNKQKIMLTGIFCGLGLGIFFGLGLHFMDSSIHTVREVEELLDLPVLSAVSTRKKLPAEWRSLPLLDTVHHQHGPISEAFRTLRSALILLGRDAERKVFLITSAVPGEGKSFTAANFAVTLAQQGLRTLLLDLDLRKPMVAKSFFEHPPERGATDVLAGQLTVSQGIVDSGIPNLAIMTAGSKAPNPSELLSSGMLPALLRELRARFDRIVIDSPPVIAVSDPLLISTLADTILQVVRSHTTPRTVVQRACLALGKASGRPVSGIVLNQLPLKSRSYYYYYYSGYYGEKGVYGAPA